MTSDRPLGPRTPEQAPLETTADRAAPVPARRPEQPAISARLSGVRSPEEAEQRYVAARDTWAAAMRAASSGRPTDMAALALAQEEYEAASAERDRWQSRTRVAVPIEPERRRSPIDIVVGQELAWRDVHRDDADTPRRPGLVGRLLGRGRKSRD